MSLRPPTEGEVRALGDQLHLDLTDEEVRDFRELIEWTLPVYEAVEDHGQPAHDYAPQRDLDAGRRRRSEDPYNAWITDCDLKTTDDGPLDGLDVGLKDNIALAGVEMTCGSTVMEGYTPNVDATIVTRLLAGGARIVGKTNMDDMALAGNGSSSSFGPTLNPVDDDYLAGGSSGGSAIAVATGEADLTIGGDQGGSVRVPAAWSGVLGLKPTHGLVPYTGIVGLENSIDHIGIFARRAETVARSLDVLAGKDRQDPRQPETVAPVGFDGELAGSVEDVSIAVVEESFEDDNSDEAVNERVRAALDVLADRGATVERVSIPVHNVAHDVYTVALLEGMLAAVRGEGLGHNWKGWYNLSWLEAFGKFRRAQGGDFPPTVKLALLCGAYTGDQYHSKFYAQAMNIRAEITEIYEALLDRHDLVAMPTAPQLPHEHRPELSRVPFVKRAWTSLTNVSTFNVTGQPALSVPVQRSDELPVGVQLAGPRFEDLAVLDAAAAVQRTLS
jgi:amidase